MTHTVGGDDGSGNVGFWGNPPCVLLLLLSCNTLKGVEMIFEWTDGGKRVVVIVQVVGDGVRPITGWEA